MTMFVRIIQPLLISNNNNLRNANAKIAIHSGANSKFAFQRKRKKKKKIDVVTANQASFTSVIRGCIVIEARSALIYSS